MKTIIMKSVLALMSILISTSAAFGDSMYIDTFDITVGETKEIPVNLTNTQPYSAFQAEIQLPAGLELVKQNDSWMTLSSRASEDHSLTVNTTGVDNVRIVCFSNTNSVFSGSDGAIMSMIVRATEWFTGGVILLNEVKLSNASNEDVSLDPTDCSVTAIVPASSIDLNYGSFDLKVGESFTLVANVYPDNASDKTVVWTSDNESVASVYDNGNVTAVSLGTATITASCGSVSASCVVTVVATPVESVTLNTTEAQLKVGESLGLSAAVLPIDATDRTVAWASDNSAVATVDADGNVTAVSLGIATITASCGDCFAICTVTVVPVMVESIIFSPESWSGEEGEAFKIEARVLPEDATDKSLVWSSSNESVATVDSEGNVSVLKEGTCVIKALAADGSGITAECIITSVSGVESIFLADDLLDVYDLKGILIKKDTDSESLKSLTPGLYLIRQCGNMKKLIIR